MSYFSEVSIGYSDTAAIDAFSRLRVSNPTTLFETQSAYGLESLKMEAGNSGTGVAPTHSADTRMIALTCTAGTGESFYQSYKYVQYQPLKSQLIAMTGVFGTGVAGAVADFGYGDDSNGIFYRQNGASGLRFVRRTKTSGSVVDNAVDKADWNIDKLDGSGVSGLTLDVTKCFILVIDLQFLGMGRVRCGFDIGGKIVWAHEFLNANVLTVPYMQTGSLPIRAILTATTTAAPKTIYFKCASVVSEGGIDQSNGLFLATPDATVTAASGAFTHLISIRPKTTYNSITNRTLLTIEDVNLLVTGNNSIHYHVVLGGTFSVAPTYADVDSTNSAFEYGTGGTYTSGGVLIDSGFVPSGNSVKGSLSQKVVNNFPISLNRAGAVREFGVMHVLVEGIGGTSATRGCINFVETR